MQESLKKASEESEKSRRKKRGKMKSVHQKSQSSRVRWVSYTKAGAPGDRDARKVKKPWDGCSFILNFSLSLSRSRREKRFSLSSNYTKFRFLKSAHRPLSPLYGAGKQCTLHYALTGQCTGGECAWKRPGTWRCSALRNSCRIEGSGMQAAVYRQWHIQQHTQCGIHRVADTTRRPLSGCRRWAAISRRWTKSLLAFGLVFSEEKSKVRKVENFVERILKF